MATAETPLLCFGVFELDLTTGELRKAGVLVKLQPQPFKVLALLASRAGQLVTREEIRQQIWGGETFVDFERGLNFCIKQIRAALGDDAETPRYVETLPRRGYRFIVAVERRARREGYRLRRWLPTPAGTVWMAVLALAVVVAAGYLIWPHLRTWIWPQPPTGKIMLAVLPLENLSGDPEQEYFSDGLTEELITQLGRLHPERLGVIARQSIMQYKNTSKDIEEIGRELGVHYILEGSVRRATDRVRISAQLIQVSDQAQLWADSYERDLRDVLVLQAEVARAVAREIDLTLTPQEEARLANPRLVNPAAYVAYHKGRYLWSRRNPEALRKSIELFEEATSKDPDYALAYVGLADTYALLGTQPYDALPPHQAMPKAKAAALRALQIDDTLAEAHTSLAYARLVYDWDWAAAEREFERALQLNPGYATAHQWYANYLWVMGRLEEALAEIHQAQEIDPRSLVLHAALGWHFYYARQYDQAMAQLQGILEMEPNFALAHFELGLAYEQKEMYDEAIAEFQTTTDLSGGHAGAVAALAHAYALAGKRAEARKLLNEVEALSKQTYVPALYLAGTYTGLGEKDEAFKWIEKAFEQRAEYLIYLALEPTFDPLRSDPRFHDVLRRLRLPR